MDYDTEQLWAYRARGVDPLTPVRVLREGTKKPARVLVHFEDDAMEGKEEWVPPTRLKVTWDRAEEFQQEEDRWNAVENLWPRPCDPHAIAVEYIIDEILAESPPIVKLDRWSITITDARQLAARTGLPIDELTSHSVSFKTEEGVVAPWPVALKVAMAASKEMPDRVLAMLDKEERTLQHSLIHGLSGNRNRTSRDLESEREIVLEVDEDGYRQSRELRREWCGEAAVLRRDELYELRKEIKRVGDVAEKAIETLHRLGHRADAKQLSWELGETIDMLRVDPD